MMNIPIDIPLAVPGNVTFLRILLVLTFITHIFFVGLMVGGTYWSVLYRILGFRNQFYNRLAKETLDTVTINKSLAVVIGVAPLLVISLIYTVYWYAVAELTYPYFLSIVWLVIVAFLSLYAYKYTWDGLGVRRPILHLMLGLVAVGIFTFVPFIFLNNINLMLLPFRWHEYSGFFRALLLPNAIPRYLHFFAADFANIGFFATAYFWYVGRNSDDPFYPRAQKVGLRWALIAILLQGIFGPLNLFTMPAGFYSTGLLVLILSAITLVTAAGVAAVWTFQEITGRRILLVLALIGSVAVLMSFIRDTVRTNLLRGPEQIAKRNSEIYFQAVHDFMETYIPPEEEGGPAKKPSGEGLFKRYCSSCHAPDRLLVGPPLGYMVDKYQGNKQEMVQFVLNPVKVNPDLPGMPKPPVNEEQATAIVDYILSGQGKGGGQEDGQASEKKSPQGTERQGETVPPGVPASPTGAQP